MKPEINGDRLLLENMPSMFQILEPICDEDGKAIDFRYIHVNKATEEFGGKKRQELEGKTAKELWGFVEDYWLDMLVKVTSTGEPVRCENYVEQFHRWFDIHAWQNRQLKDQVAVLLSDITDRKQAEEVLRQSQKMLTQLIERSPFGSYVVDSQFKIAMMNESSRNGAFANIRPIIGRPFNEVMYIIWHHEVADEIIGHFRHTLNTGEPYYSTQFINPRHDEKHVESYEWQLHRMVLPDGQFGVICYYFDSTKLRQAEDALRESEERFRVAQELSPDGFSILRPIRNAEGRILDFRWVYANPAVERIVGMPLSDLMGHSMIEKIPGHHNSAFQKAYQEAAETGKTCTLEALYEGDGIMSQHWFRVAVVPMGDNIAVLSQDITERKHAVEGLKESEQRMQMALKLGHSFAFEWDIASDRVLRSDSCADILGLTGEEAEHDTGQRYFQRVHGKDRDNFVRMLDELEPTADTYHTEYSLLRGDGTIVILEESGQAFFDAEGKLCRLIGVAVDITDHKRSEEELKRMSDQLAEGQQIAHLGSWEYIAATQTTVWSDETKRMFGLDTAKPSPDYKTLLQKYTHPDDVAELDRSFREAIATHKPFENENRIVRADGTVGWISNKAFPYFDEQGKLVRYVGTTLDITERKTAELALKQLNEELKRSNKELEEFAYIASHDLREPLRAISGFTQLLKEKYKGKLDEKADEYINYTVKGVSRMDALLSCLLEYSRVNTHRQNLAPVSANDCLDAAIDNLSKSILETNAEITHDNLPKVEADGRQLTQLFQNLIHNAIKFCDKKPPKIHIGSRKETKNHLFWVKDNGIGIDKDYHERIFKIFQRLHGQDQYSGQGIGLSICKKIVERHGGKIWLESQVGKGSTFMFTIPSR